MAHCGLVRLVKLTALLLGVVFVLLTVRFIDGRTVSKSSTGRTVSVLHDPAKKLAEVRSEGSRNRAIFDEPRRFVLGWNFWEQLMMATSSYFSLVWFASQWSARTVTPFTLNSGLYGVPSWNGIPTRPFDIIFNETEVNEILHQKGQPPLVEFQKFVHDSVRDLTVLHFFYNGEDLKYFSKIAGNAVATRNGLISQLKNDFVIDCCQSPYVKKIMKLFLTSLNAKLPRRQWFNVSNCFCINASHPTDPDILAQRCGISYDGSYTVVMNNWRGVTGSKELRTTPKGVVNNFRLFVPKFDSSHLLNPARDVYPYNSIVRLYAMHFRHDLVRSSDFVAVHIRGEKLGLRDKWIPGYFMSCWQKVLTVLQTNILRPSNTTTVIFFTDSNSLTCHSNCRGARLVAEVFKQEGIKQVQFNPYSYGSPVSDKGLVAVVEQSLAAMAKHLVLLGGGSFQAQLRARFKSQSSSGKSYSICWEDSVEVQVS